MSTAIKDRVPNGPFKEKVFEVVEREGITLSEIAQRAGWVSGRGTTNERGDTTYLQRLLGMCSWSSSKGTYEPRPWMSYAAAVKLCDALGLDYTDMDL